MGIISQRIRKKISEVQTRKVIKIKELQNIARLTEDFRKSMKTPEELRDLHPIHAVYVSAQNLVSLLAENLSKVPDLDEYCDIIGAAEEEYLPQGPPMSPLTVSYFTSWAFFDVRMGKDKETIGTCLMDLGADLGISSEFVEVIQLMQESRMGVYEHCGNDKVHVYLRDLVTAKDHKCLVASQYLGKKKQLWYVRLLPAPFGISETSLVYTTPYVLISPGKAEWKAFLERTILKIKEENSILAYETLMKYGLHDNYWNEFIFQAYVNNEFNAIYLTGLPDIPGTLPHSS